MAQRKKAADDTFTSFRVLGKKAQELIQRASSELQKRRKKDVVHSDVPFDSPSDPDAMLTVRFSPLSILQSTLVIVAVVLGLALVVWLRDVIILLLLGFFVAAIIDPGVRMMERWGVPRGIGVLIHYLFAFLILVFLMVSLIPLIADQLQQIAFLINTEVNRFLADPDFGWVPFVSAEVKLQLADVMQATLRNMSIESFTDALSSLSENMSSVGVGGVLFITSLAGSVAGFVAKSVIVIVLAFFIQMEREHIRQWVRGFLGSRSRLYMDDKTEAIHHKIGQWARGQLMLGFCIGLLVYIALLILGMEEYAATLAVLAGFTEFIPYIGPFIAAVPAVLIGMTTGGFWWALGIMLVYYVIQWCENNLLVPLIMRRAVGLSPIAIIFAMLSGLSFPQIVHPILGLLLAVPVTTIVTIFLEDWREHRRS
jgi:predicted PurR-regulated permease PerM